MQNSLAVDAFIFILQKRETSGNMCFLQNKCVEQICSKDKGFLSCSPNTQQKSSPSSKIANQSIAEQKRVARNCEFRFLNIT